MMKRLFEDEVGQVHSSEYLLMMVLLGIGAIVGLATLRDQVAQELADSGAAISALDQSFTITVPGSPGPVTKSYTDPGPAFTDPSPKPAFTGPAGMEWSLVVGNESANVGTSDGDSP